MCGRYASFRETQDLADAFAVAPDDVAEDAALLPPSWNVAPTDAVRVVVERTPSESRTPGAPPGTGVDAVRSLRLARWGLVPSWAKDPSVGSRMINARVESLTEKPAFKRAVATRRCLVPAEGYYEWQAAPEGSSAKTPKQPFWIHASDRRPLAFAGLFEFWRDPSRPDDDLQRWLVTTTILTGGAPTKVPALAAIHDRRPVILAPDRWDAWLDPGRQDPAEAVELVLRATPVDELRLAATPVSTAVNKVSTNGPQLIDPVDQDRPA